jgi:hypothetical protein
MDEPLPVLPILFALLLLAVFVLPGYAWVSWLHRSDRLGWPWRLVLGFTWSFALFSLLGAPFLWFGGSTRAFLLTFCPAWTLFALAAVTLYVAYRRGYRTTELSASSSTTKPSRKREDPAAVPVSWRAWAIFVAYAVLIVAMLSAWTLGSDPKRLAERRAWITERIPVLLLFGGLLAWRWRAHVAPLLKFGQDDEAPAPRLWTVVAGSLIVLQAVSAVAYYRPDWDDCYYLAAVLDYEDAQVLNDQEPTHREGFPVSAHQRFMCWELWGAVLCRFSGLNPMVVFHSVLPALLVLVSYAAYSMLLAQFLPQRWVPLALLGLSAYFLWGISGQLDAANHLLVRVWQGKSVMLHIVLPLMVVSLVRFAERPSWRWWLTLTACVGSGVAASASAVFMEGALICCLAPLLLLTMRTSRFPFVLGAIMSLAPLALAALAIKSGLGAEEALLQGSATMSAGDRWLGYFLAQASEGSATLIWILCLPLLAVLLAGWPRQVYLLGVPVLLLLTFANPFLTKFVTLHFTSQYGYYRLLWLFPVGVGLAALFALLARLLSRMVSRSLGTQLTYIPLTICTAGLLLCALLPGKYAWSARNMYQSQFMAPRLAQNPEKMPGDLLPIIRRLAEDPEIDKVRILAAPDVTSFMTSYSRDFRFVYTRPNYTLPLLRLQGRTQEAIERHYLRLTLMLGMELAPLDWNFLADNLGKQAVSECQSSHAQPTEQTFPQLLSQYRVLYVITSPLLDVRSSHDRAFSERTREKNLGRAGYVVAYRGKEYVLWKRRTEFTLGSEPPG